MVLADARRVPLQDGCVQCVLTSPPYFGLRDYGTAKWEGGDPECDHIPLKDIHAAAVAASGLGGGKSNQANAEASRSSFRGGCGKCGAIRHDSQIGLEPSPDAYVASLVAVFRELRRVLADDGVCWLNLGDSYAANGPKINNNGSNGTLGHKHSPTIQSKTRGMQLPAINHGLKPKDLIGIPWRVAFALQADGWYLRSDIIWSKPNQMPESVTDRPTKAHEYVFLLTKSERYFYDAEAIKENVGTIYTRPASKLAIIDSGVLKSPGIHGGFGRDITTDGRNVRSVWTIATKPYAGAHFATMPEKLAERCILASSRPGDLVFDPFGGSGTTVRVARRFNRRGVMLDLNPAYLELAKQRNANLQPSILDLADEASA